MSGARGMLPTVFDIEPPGKNSRIHQAEKPVELLQQLLGFVTEERSGYWISLQVLFPWGKQHFPVNGMQSALKLVKNILKREKNGFYLQRAGAGRKGGHVNGTGRKTQSGFWQ